MPTRVIGRAKDIGGEPTSNATVRKLTFTGSTEVGKLLMEQCAGTVKKLSLELGGNAPFIVFDDADIEAAVKGAIASKYRNAGQTCVCANRILVQDGVYDAFTKRLAETAGAMKVADGFEPGAVIGPLIDMKAVEKVEAHIADALKKGAKVVTGGKRAAQGGSFFEPTVLTDVTTDMVITKEETLARSPRPTASRPTPTRSRWPTTPNSASPPISTAATSAASGASPRPSNTASSASTKASSRPRSPPSAA
jgi:succinate-semialdehyde dehydrogenase / glutarate-semialdehyde dehydrogenase